jgi:hypothetical protein
MIGVGTVLVLGPNTAGNEKHESNELNDINELGAWSCFRNPYEGALGNNLAMGELRAASIALPPAAAAADGGEASSSSSSHPKKAFPRMLTAQQPMQAMRRTKTMMLMMMVLADICEPSHLVHPSGLSA